MEKQVQSIYTAAMFLEFQKELTEKTYCEVISIQDDSSVITYHIEEQMWIPKSLDEESCEKEDSDLEEVPESPLEEKESSDLEEAPKSPLEEEKESTNLEEALESPLDEEKIMIRVMFKVSFKKDECEFECSCHNFEFRGIVCKHAIIVLHRNNIYLLPEKYLLKRWRKDVKRLHTDVPVSSDAWQLNPKQRRYNQMCNSFAVLAEVASSSDVMSTDIDNWIQDKVKATYSNAETSCKLNTGVETTKSAPIGTIKAKNPPTAKTKGARGRARQNVPKPKKYTAKKPRKGKENVEVNTSIPAQQANNSVTNLTYDQYLQVMKPETYENFHLLSILKSSNINRNQYIISTLIFHGWLCSKFNVSYPTSYPTVPIQKTVCLIISLYSLKVYISIELQYFFF
ncbi:hypothetical protein MKW94_001555 [Papaver nudicaule]|uniref:SWIM-type domain-containing protein n=1 Tax=Papaver nudicaule TaxID=74823 RepID=A0AA41V5P3_PAPNU|nr:hypothetical protein [Papaver nudicaule]